MTALSAKAAAMAFEKDESLRMLDDLQAPFALARLDPTERAFVQRLQVSLDALGKNSFKTTIAERRLLERLTDKVA